MAKVKLASLKPIEGVLTLLHPQTEEPTFHTDDGREVQQTITMVGRNSKQFYNFMREMGVKQVQPGKAFERWSDEHAAMLAACIVGWSDDGIFDAPYSAEDALELMKNDENDWIRQQVFFFLLDETHFFSTPSK